MSQATMAQLTILSAIGGAIKTAADHDVSPTLAALLESARLPVDAAISGWPITGGLDRHYRHVARAVGEWIDALEASGWREESVSITGSVAMALHLLTDLDEATHAPGKKALLQPCFAPLQACFDYLTEGGAEMPSIEWAEGTAGALYGAAGFGN